MENIPRRPIAGPAGPGRSVTIKDLAAELELSITTISRALAGYPDVGEKTRLRVTEAAQKMGYRPNRNAQRLVTQRTHNIAWVQPDNERKFLDPHFVEVMAGVLRGARAEHYDIVMTSDTPDNELSTYDRYVKDNSVDGFIVDLPREHDARISYLLDMGRPFVVHGRETRHARYGWVDVDNYGNFYRLTRLLLANGHTHLAFINGDEHYNYALYRHRAVADAMSDHGLAHENLTMLNTVHPMGDAGFRLTQQALEDRRNTAILYSSALMAIEGHSAIVEAKAQHVALASMDDQLHYLDINRIAGAVTFVRSSLRDAGLALVAELARQCERKETPRGTLIPSYFHVQAALDASGLYEPLPPHRRHLAD